MLQVGNETNRLISQSISPWATEFRRFLGVNIFNSRYSFFQLDPTASEFQNDHPAGDSVAGAQQNLREQRLAGGGFPHGGFFALKNNGPPQSGRRE